MIYKDLRVVGLAILGTALLVLLPRVALAEDLLVVCPRGGGPGSCSMSPDNEPLFDEDDFKPGDTRRQNFEVRNERDEVCELTFDVDETKQEPNDFADRLFTLIEEGSTDWYGQGDSNAATDDKNLDDLYGAGPIDLGIIDPDETRNFKWIVTFDRDAGNEYQRAETKFDLNFECESVPAVEGAMSGFLGKVFGDNDKFVRFPATGDESTASIWQGEKRSSKVLALLLAVVLGLFLIFKVRREKLAKNS